ncbi:MAG TPA: hypothetical protein DCS05_04370 [Nitrospiraceae bacterium]|nr:hypothetical protein [Nitrospiraceae bacterium]
MNRSDQNRQDVVKSAIIAKATLQRQDGRIEFVIVFQNSTRQEFFWVLRAKKARSPRRAWKMVNYYNRDFTMGQAPYNDFGSFVRYYAERNHAEVLNVQVFQARRLAGMRGKLAYESIFTDWTPQAELDQMTFVRCDKVTRRMLHRAY